MISRTGSDHRNISLQALRGLAACSVMVYHAAYFTTLRTGAAWLDQVFSGKLGFYGVLVFFVLSGYLMEGAIRRYDARTFALHRFVRIYPTYWLLCAGFFAVQAVRTGALAPIPWKALNLLPLGEMSRPLAVEWTLLYEVFFYFICTLLCVWPRALLPGFLIWLGIVAIAVFGFGQFGTTGQPTFVQIPFSAWNVAFICGALAGQLQRSSANLNPAWLLLGGIALILLGQLAAPVVDFFLLAPGTACIVLALVLPQPSEAKPPGLVKRALFVVGECSYGLYLSHSLGIQIAMQYVPASRWSQPISIFVGMLGVGLTLGLITGSMDILLYRTLKRWIDTHLRQRAVAAEL
jgi:peptidoglycan/LPS O-acetylase OafA/YrhL